MVVWYASFGKGIKWRMQPILRSSRGCGVHQGLVVQGCCSPWPQCSELHIMLLSPSHKAPVPRRYTYLRVHLPIKTYLQYWLTCPMYTSLPLPWPQMHSEKDEKLRMWGLLRLLEFHNNRDGEWEGPEVAQVFHKLEFEKHAWLLFLVIPSKWQLSLTHVVCVFPLPAPIWISLSCLGKRVPCNWFCQPQGQSSWPRAEHAVWLWPSWAQGLDRVLTLTTKREADLNWGLGDWQLGCYFSNQGKGISPGPFLVTSKWI